MEVEGDVGTGRERKYIHDRNHDRPFLPLEHVRRRSAEPSQRMRLYDRIPRARRVTEQPFAVHSGTSKSPRIYPAVATSGKADWQN